MFEIKYYAKDLRNSKELLDRSFNTEYFVSFNDEFSTSIKSKDIYSIVTLGKLVSSYYNETKHLIKFPLINYEDSKRSFRKLTLEEELLFLNALNSY